MLSATLQGMQFWRVLVILFQDVSDRIEKESEESELLVLLQKDSIPVVRGDWKVHLGSELQEGEYNERNWKRKRFASSWFHLSDRLLQIGAYKFCFIFLQIFANLGLTKAPMLGIFYALCGTR